MKPINELSYYNWIYEGKDNQEYVATKELSREVEYKLSDLLSKYGHDAIVHCYDTSSYYDQHSEYRTYVKYRVLETDDEKIERLNRIQRENERKLENLKKEISAKKQELKNEQDYQKYLELKKRFENE